jgi:cell division protein FtsW (lipid II flippase)
MLLGLALIVKSRPQGRVREHAFLLIAVTASIMGLWAMPDTVSTIFLCAGLVTIALATPAPSRWRKTVAAIGVLPIASVAALLVTSPFRLHRVRDWYLSGTGAPDPVGADWAYEQSLRLIIGARWLGGTDLSNSALPMRMDWYALPHLAAGYGKLALILAMLTLLGGSVWLLVRMLRQEHGALRPFWVAAAGIYLLNALLVCGAPLGFVPYVGFYSTPLLAPGEGTILALILLFRALTSAIPQHHPGSTHKKFFTNTTPDRSRPNGQVDF